jgi:quercetin dioxygenase-like cupin family protein
MRLTCRSSALSPRTLSSRKGPSVERLGCRPRSLCVIIVYMALCLGGIAFFRRVVSNPILHGLVPLIGFVVFGAAPYGSIHPRPPAPLHWAAYIAHIWLVLGLVVVGMPSSSKPEAIIRIGSILGEEGPTMGTKTLWAPMVHYPQRSLMSNEQQHFSLEGASTPTADGRFVDVSQIDGVEFVPGLTFQPVLGERSLVNFVSFEKNTEAPVHVHEEEQIVIVLDGEFDFEIDGEIRHLAKGDVAVIPPWVPHGARTENTTCLEVDVFTPPRKTLLDAARAASEKAGDNWHDPAAESGH